MMEVYGLYLLEKNMFIICVDLNMLVDNKEYLVFKCLEYFEKCL